MTTKMKNKTLYIAGILALSLQTSTLRAQEVADKSFYSFERIELKTPWLTSENGAGLVFNNAKNFSTVGGYFQIKAEIIQIIMIRRYMNRLAYLLSRI